MVLLNLTVGLGLLLIIAFADAQLQCYTNCVTGETAEGDWLILTCSGSAPVTTWHKNNKDRTRLQLTNTGQAQAEAPEGNPWFCYGKDPNGMNRFCTPLPCKVLYSVRSVTTWPLLFASPGEEITCMAEGNPTPTFSWEGMDESGKWMDIPGATSETIDALLNDGTFTSLRCGAKNTYKGGEHFLHSDSISVGSSSTMSTSSAKPEVIVSNDGALTRNAIIGSVVAVIVIAIIVVVIIQVKCPEAMPCKLSEVFGCGGNL